MLESWRRTGLSNTCLTCTPPPVPNIIPLLVPSAPHLAARRRPSARVMVPVCRASQEKWQSREPASDLQAGALQSVIRHFHAAASQPARLTPLPPSSSFFSASHSHSLFPHILFPDIIYPCNEWSGKSRWEKDKLDCVEWSLAACFEEAGRVFGERGGLWPYPPHIPASPRSLGQDHNVLLTGCTNKMSVQVI